MHTIHQIIKIEDDRQLHLTLPPDITPGLTEVIIVLQACPATTETEPSDSQPEHPLPTTAAQNYFGFLPRRIDPIVFQQQLRHEWHR